MLLLHQFGYIKEGKKIKHTHNYLQMKRSGEEYKGTECSKKPKNSKENSVGVSSVTNEALQRQHQPQAPPVSSKVQTGTRPSVPIQQMAIPRAIPPFQASFAPPRGPNARPPQPPQVRQLSQPPVQSNLVPQGGPNARPPQPPQVRHLLNQNYQGAQNHVPPQFLTQQTPPQMMQPRLQSPLPIIQQHFNAIYESVATYEQNQYNHQIKKETELESRLAGCRQQIAELRRDLVTLRREKEESVQRAECLQQKVNDMEQKEKESFEFRRQRAENSRNLQREVQKLRKKNDKLKEEKKILKENEKRHQKNTTTNSGNRDE